MGWLHAIPKDCAESRFACAVKIDVDIDLPNVDDVLYVLGYFLDIGIVEYGPKQLSCSEIYAWQKCSKVELSIWEFKTLRYMSTAYLKGLSDGESVTSESPYGESNNFILLQKREIDLGLTLKRLSKK